MLTFPGQVNGQPALFLIDVPEAETPSQHIRNGLMLLSLLKEQSPATWVMNPALQRAALRATAAMVLLDHEQPADLAQCQLRAAIEALLTADLDWEVITDIPAACSRFFIALFALEPTPQLDRFFSEDR